jgi:hypothetical protein
LFDDGSFANEPFAVFPEREECQGGGFSLLANLTRRDRFRLRLTVSIDILNRTRTATNRCIQFQNRGQLFMARTMKFPSR